MIAGAEEAIADFHPNSGVGRPVLMDEAAVEEVGVARTGIDEGRADVNAADQAVFQDRLVDRLLVVEQAAVVEGAAILVADLVGQGEPQEMTAQTEAAGAAAAVDEGALVQLIGDADAADEPGCDAPGETC